MKDGEEDDEDEADDDKGDDDDDDDDDEDDDEADVSSLYCSTVLPVLATVMYSSPEPISLPFCAFDAKNRISFTHSSLNCVCVCVRERFECEFVYM